MCVQFHGAFESDASLEGTTGTLFTGKVVRQYSAAPAKAPSLDAVVGMIASNEATPVNVLQPQGHNWPTYNPYPVLGAPNLPSWPRGLPLADIKKEQCSNTTVTNTKLQVKSIAVLQSLAEVQPDVDAIFRITMSMPRPFAFIRTDETRPLMIPSGVLTPYNAQATLHFESAFWALLLPITVHGRVSDIWRSYLAQRLFWDCDLQVGFTARPLVVHERTEHSDLGDLDAERDLYMKSEHLVKFLGSWKATGTTLAERIEELWIALYERQYIELKDVELVQHWLQSLFQVGYTFPSLKYKSLPIPMQGRRYRGGRGGLGPPTFKGRGAEPPHFHRQERSSTTSTRYTRTHRK